jgi:hypothetical protein
MQFNQSQHVILSVIVSKIRLLYVPWYIVKPYQVVHMYHVANGTILYHAKILWYICMVFLLDV